MSCRTKTLARLVARRWPKKKFRIMFSTLPEEFFTLVSEHLLREPAEGLWPRLKLSGTLDE